jgi:photosystem II stability/assembly factor-like uncharacterized protein
MTRRQVLQGTGATAAAAVLGVGRGAWAAPRAEVKDTKDITHQPRLYHGWPTVARRSNGQLLVSYSGGRAGHVCPFGRVELIRSDDDGQTWSDATVLKDSPIDDRDSGVLETDKGTILVTSFTSLYYVESIFQRAMQKGPNPYSDERLKRWEEEYSLKRWKEQHFKLTAEQRLAELGVWMLRSTDGGATWSKPYRCVVNSPHGPAQLSDGRQLYAGKKRWQGEQIGVCQSTDDGQSWQWIGQIPTRPGDDFKLYHELHVVEAAGGRTIVQIRNHNKTNAAETLQSHSTDGGKTWSMPRSIGVWGMPSHLMRLRDGRLLMSYGHRRDPFGNQARVSEDDGRSWSEPIIIYGDGITVDSGYPTTVQLADGSLLTVWYEVMKSSPKAVLRQARWTLEG